MSDHHHVAAKHPQSRGHQRRVLGVGVGGAVLAWGAAAVTGAPTADADVLDAVIDPVVSAATAAISPVVESTADIGAALVVDPSSVLDLGSIAGSVVDVTHLAALPVEATSAAAVDPLATSAVSAASLDELLNQFLQQTVQPVSYTHLGSRSRV